MEKLQCYSMGPHLHEDCRLLWCATVRVLGLHLLAVPGHSPEVPVPQKACIRKQRCAGIPALNTHLL